MRTISIDPSADPRKFLRRNDDKIMKQVIDWPERMQVYERRITASIHTPTDVDTPITSSSRSLIRWIMAIGILITSLAMFKLSRFDLPFQLNQNVSWDFVSDRMPQNAFPDLARYLWAGFHRIAGTG